MIFSQENLSQQFLDFKSYYHKMGLIFMAPKLFADTSDLNEIKKLNAAGLVDGITTNPVIVAQNAGHEDPVKYYQKLLLEFPEKAVSIQLLDDTVNNMVEQGVMFSELGSNVVVKVPFLPNLVALEVAKRLHSKKIKTNITALMKFDQAILSVKSLAPEGPTYVSLFFNRIKRTTDPKNEIAKTREFIDQFDFKTEIISGSIHSGQDVFDSWTSGSHIVTATPKVIHSMEEDNRTIEFINQSREAWDNYIAKNKTRKSMASSNGKQ